MSKTLKLTLNKQWFDLIEKGIKTEEYRELKKYWFDRLVFKKEMVIKFLQLDFEIPDYFNIQLENIASTKQKAIIGFIAFDNVEFTNGYNKKSPQITKECLGIEICQGKNEWGAVKDKYYFTIKLGREVGRLNC
jgi:hypothetical protein